MDYLKRIAEILESGELVSFGFSDKYITIDKRADKGYDVEAYYSCHWVIIVKICLFIKVKYY